MDLKEIRIQFQKGNSVGRIDEYMAKIREDQEKEDLEERIRRKQIANDEAIALRKKLAADRRRGEFEEAQVRRRKQREAWEKGTHPFRQRSPGEDRSPKWEKQYQRMKRKLVKK